MLPGFLAKEVFGMPKRRSSNPENRPSLTTRHSFRHLCRVMSNRYPLWMALSGWMDTLRYVTKTVPVPCSMIPHSLLLPAAIIRFIRISTVASGMRSAVKQLLIASLYTKAENRCMTVTMSVLYRWKPFVISRPRHALESRSHVTMSPLKHLKENAKYMQTAGPAERTVRLFCF